MQQSLTTSLTGSSAPSFTLYHLPTCPFCRRVRRAAAELDIPLQLVDISEDPAARGLLMMTRGRTTVPVLRVDEAARAAGASPPADKVIDLPGGDQLLPESADIIEFLRDVHRQTSSRRATNDASRPKAA